MAPIKEFEHLKIQLEAIKSATKDFSDDYCVGGGGFGKVYKGEIDHSKGQHTMVAIKRLDRKFGQGDPEFWKEIMMLSFYKHENIVSLLGYCDDSGEKILVYEYAPKKSLDAYLNYEELKWVQRLKICIGSARGLAYLHTPVGSQLRVLHRDIKSSNILLDENWNAKIADFGLSKFGPANQQFTYLISNVVGTHGYCDPLYAETGLLTKETDVYPFGVVLFEVLCGRLCNGNKSNNLRPLIGLVREYYKENNIGQLIYGSIKDEINSESLKEFTELAYQCIHREPKERPLMTHIVGKLESSLKYQEVKEKAEAEAKAKAEADAEAKAKAVAEADAMAKAVAEAKARAVSEAKEKAVVAAKAVTGILNLKALRIASVEKSRERFTASNPYLIFRLTGYGGKLKRIMKTSVKHNQQNPEWNEELNLFVENFDENTLEIQLIDVISEKKHDHVGGTTLILGSLTPEIRKTCDLEIIDSSFDCIGKIMVESVYLPLSYDQFLYYIEYLSRVQKAPIVTPRGGGLLVVIIHRANLYSEESRQHASVLLLFRGQSRETLIMMNTIYPVWEQEFIFMLEETPRSEEKLHFEVVNNNDNWLTGFISGKKKYLGRADMEIADVVSSKRVPKELRLFKNQISNSYNSLYVELQWRTSY